MLKNILGVEIINGTALPVQNRGPPSFFSGNFWLYSWKSHPLCLSLFINLHTGATSERSLHVTCLYPMWAPRGQDVLLIYLQVPQSAVSSPPQTSDNHCWKNGPSTGRCFFPPVNLTINFDGPGSKTWSIPSPGSYIPVLRSQSHRADHSLAAVPRKHHHDSLSSASIPGFTYCPLSLSPAYHQPGRCRESGPKAT